MRYLVALILLGCSAGSIEPSEDAAVPDADAYHQLANCSSTCMPARCDRTLGCVYDPGGGSSLPDDAAVQALNTSCLRDCVQHCSPAGSPGMCIGGSFICGGVFAATCVER